MDEKDDQEMKDILRDVEVDWDMSGLSAGLYGDYASEVAKRWLRYKLRTWNDDVERTRWEG